MFNTTTTIHGRPRGQLTPQEYFTFRDDKWWPVEPPPTPASTSTQPSTTPNPFRLSVLSWNIDFMRDEDDARMSAALDYLGTYIAGIRRDSGDSAPVVVMLNEMTAGDLRLIKLAGWIREGYDITDATTVDWESDAYGTTMLIPRNFSISSVARLHYTITAMQRDALFNTTPTEPGPRPILRLCTTHLESLAAKPPKRPAQLAAAAEYLRGGKTGGGGKVLGGILGGDLNAIEAFDKTLPEECGLKDAFLENGGKEGEEGGMTWGQMAEPWQRARFGLGRLDKILFCGEEKALKLVGFKTFGLGVTITDQQAAERLLQRGSLEQPWVTDHLGVRADFLVEVPGIGDQKEEAG
ncbi:Endonuclease/exonuclease/phosphatase [Dichotomopilus funicola]|uniref:Endonuclease/exonuclease/phosphatase n=1 Tax=Dichotomopilus funicola TaxID=1934379 RepID=A0AAN6ZJG7_9PEZI|nr:Endonuclease/exonuclease/phosphatase [Dichotomopilus funicola]